MEAVVLSQSVSKCRCAPGASQKALKRAKKRFKNVRQRLDWSSGAVDLVVPDDVPDSRLWEDTCFKLDLFDVHGTAKTKADALSDWVLAKYSKQCCLNYFKKFNLVEPKQTMSIPEAWKSSTLKRLREELYWEDEERSD